MALSAAPKRLLSLDEVRHLIPYSASQIYRLEHQDRFPRRLRIGPNRVAWLQDEVESWVQQRIDDRRKTQMLPDDAG
jgi:prophage regulatory protein